MSLFKAMAEAKTQGRGQKIQEMALGESMDYIVRIDDIKLQESNRPGDGTLFIPEFTVLRGTERTPRGCKRSWVQYPVKRAATDLGRIKLFIAECKGVSKDVLTEADFEAADKGAYNGEVLRLNVEHTKTNSGFDFFVHSWERFAGDADSLLADLPDVPEQSSAGSTPPATPATDNAPPPPPPASAKELTREAWLAGAGPGTKGDHGEWCPGHADWGWRPAR